MKVTRQPLLTLSPSQHVHVSTSNAEQTESSPQTTPKLPRRERLASFSRLVKKKNFSLSEEKNENSVKRSPRARVEPSVNIRVSPCSPRRNQSYVFLAEDDKFLRSGKEFLSPEHLPFSPRLLNKVSPVNLSPSYRKPSPLKSPLYKPDNRRNYLGRGSFGKVSLCKYKDRNFAVKVTHNLSRFIGEKNLLSIRHPHLVEIFYISNVLGRTLIFMEFAGHCNLQQVLDTKSELDFRRKLSFCIQIASGLRHCHQNRIIHGDVKPANVMVSPLGICKLGDFGNSTTLGTYSCDKSPRPPEDIVGTAAYAAPEVLRGSFPTQFSDIYSYGILLWQMESREMPFAGEHPHVIIYKVANYGEKPKFSKDTGTIIKLYIEIAESCLRSVPEDRMNASQVLSSLQNIMQNIKNCNGSV